MNRLGFTVLSLWLGAAGVHAQGTSSEQDDPRTFDWGPLASRLVDINGDLRTRALGPVLEKARSADGIAFRAIRPFYSHVDHPEGNWDRSEYLWPIGSAKTLNDEFSWRFLLCWYWNFDTTQEDSRYRFWLIPFYFQGRDVQGDSYLALFPVAGSIHDFLLQDEINFALWPLWMTIDQGEIHTQSYLWPFISRTQGKGIYRFRVFPFYGQNKHRDQYKKRFVLWPFWTWAEYYLPDSEGSGYILFPLYGRMSLTNQESWMFLPPFFRFARGDRLNETYAPWPFFQKSEGESERVVVWPFYGRRQTHLLKREYFLWPFFRTERIEREEGVRRGFRFIPLLQLETDTAKDEHGKEGEVTGHFRQLWPLFSSWREGDYHRFRCLELWPYRRTGPMERLYVPWWTLFQRIENESGRETEVLWGTYRGVRKATGYRYTSLFPIFDREQDPVDDRAEWSLLKGLVGYEREGTQKRVRLLYFLAFGNKDTND